MEQDEATGEWTQDGVSIPDREPNLWITRLVGDKVRPAPRIETKWACVTPDPAERRYVTITLRERSAGETVPGRWRGMGATRF